MLFAVCIMIPLGHFRILSSNGISEPVAISTTQSVADKSRFNLRSTFSSCSRLRAVSIIMIKKCSLMLLILATLLYSEARSINDEEIDSDATTTICPEETQKNNAGNNTNLNLENENPTESDDLDSDNEAITTTTIPPEELEKNPTTTSSEITTQEEQTDLPPKAIIEELENTLEDLEELVTENLEENVTENLEESTTPCPKETEEPTTINIATEEITEEISTTTICPEELAKLTVKNILTFQKDSALYKLVKNKLKLKRTRRQVQYYGTQQRPYGKVKTYQQIQRQYAKPVKSYVRYPNNNGGRKYYRNKAVNRRQFASASSTTSRPTRAVIKKKFRPSPVFA